MSLAVVRSRALIGLSAPPVSVEVHVGNGLPAFAVVGLPEAEVRESRERVRAALLHTGFDFPNRRLTVNLAPADLPKESGRFDLPIALGILAATDQLPLAALGSVEFVGELSLTGAIRPIRGALAMAVAVARDEIADSLVLPARNAEEAALVDGPRILAADTLESLVAQLRGDAPLRCVERDIAGAARAAAVGSEGAGRRSARSRNAGSESADSESADSEGAASDSGDFREVRGHRGAKRALEIAAAGRHHLLMLGPPGAGKSLLAARLPSILPPLDDDEALEAASVASLSGGFRPERWRLRPFRSPHHSASTAALVGGGSNPRPGEISLAHLGILFLDELPEFRRSALEALREPLETGRIALSRAARQIELPARFQLIAAMNPCPCGYLGDSRCRCTPDQIFRYQARLSGPLLDRIDIQLSVRPVDETALTSPPDGESSAQIAARVAAAHRRQHERQRTPNSLLGPDGLARNCPLDDESLALLHAAARRLRWSSRALHRVQRLARTIADLAERDAIEATDVGEAIGYRRALDPLAAGDRSFAHG
ncbi:MAG TPA: YifB family Mg chelatase-like AAA ATPase [Burkholderiaceae bacterium]|nr:YifB family Mg chelatase-like AAA ATPase [Burkholderiaceae bacterium]